MSGPPDATPDEALAQALAEFEAALESGAAPDIEGFCERYPAIRDRLRKAISIARRLAELDHAEPQPGPPPRPTRLGPYVLLEELGRGGMAPVFRARDERLQRDLAIKLLYPDPLGGSARERFLREAHALAKIDHPHVVPIHDVGEEHPWCYLVMELMDGSLADRPSGTTPRQAVQWILEAAEGIAHAHSKGVLHRDVKPANLLLGADGHVRVGDFGLARIEGEERLTATGRAIGTPRYAAPEQWRGEPPTAASDLYGLGASLYHLLTGRAPPDPLSDSAWPLTFPAPLPRALRAVVSRAMAPRAAERYPDVAALAADLRSYLGGTGVRARLPRAVARRRLALAAVAALLLAGFGATWFYLGSTSRHTDPPGGYIVWRGTPDQDPESVAPGLGTRWPEFGADLRRSGLVESTGPEQVGQRTYHSRVVRDESGSSLVLVAGGRTAARLRLVEELFENPQEWRVLERQRDVDGDGLPEALLARPPSFAVVKWEPSAWADAALGWRARVDNPFFIGSVAVEDWDGDRRPDVLVGDSSFMTRSNQFVSNLYVLDLGTGARRRSVPLLGRIHSTPQFVREPDGSVRGLYLDTTTPEGALQSASLYFFGTPAAPPLRREFPPGTLTWPVFDDVDGDGREEVLVASVDGRSLFCLARDLQGDALWTFPTGGRPGYPLLSQQDSGPSPEVCLGSEGAFRCLRTAPGLGPDERVVWSAQVPDNQPFWNQPVELGDLDGDGFAELACGGYQHVYVFSRSAPTHVLLDLAAPDLFATGSDDAGGVFSARVAVLPGAVPDELSLVAVTEDGLVLCWSIRAGRAVRRWTFSAGAVYASPQTLELPGRQPMILLASTNSWLYLLEPPAPGSTSPRIAWSLRAEAGIGGTPAVIRVDDRPWVVFTDMQGYVYAVPILL